MHKISNSETKVTEVISFILEQFRNERVNQDLIVTTELILIARILHQRFRVSNGKKIKEDKSVILAKNEILIDFKKSGTSNKNESCPLSLLISIKPTSAPAAFNAITISLFSEVG